MRWFKKSVDRLRFVPSRRRCVSRSVCSLREGGRDGAQEEYPMGPEEEVRIVKSGKGPGKDSALRAV